MTDNQCNLIQWGNVSAILTETGWVTREKPNQIFVYMKSFTPNLTPFVYLYNEEGVQGKWKSEEIIEIKVD